MVFGNLFKKKTKSIYGENPEDKKRELEGLRNQRKLLDEKRDMREAIKTEKRQIRGHTIVGKLQNQAESSVKKFVKSIPQRTKKGITKQFKPGKRKATRTKTKVRYVSVPVTVEKQRSRKQVVKTSSIVDIGRIG
ncbi:MAG: hypothetical protein CL528_13395 [Aequorivita sp.]|jgi:hypothetical protein|nr:hypothetical protein [Aequorivita sp.]|tara:strand:+ start:13956 stop:14360 length:405 start_codon:yes stop_codon:yes gene_type:complete